MKLTLKYSIALLFCAVFTTSLDAQTLGELKSKFDNMGMKPKKKASKKVYINSFSVLVEVYREDIDYKGKREFRGKGRAEATAAAALGLLGVDGTLLQKKTDQLYDEFMSDLKANGFEIVNGEEAKKTDFHKNSVSFSGPMVRESANPGLLEVIPTNFKGYTTEKNASGKNSNKSGLFAGVKQLGTLVKNTNMLSKQLDDAIVIDVNLALTWSEAGGTWLQGLGGANAQIKTNLALGEKAVAAPSDNKKKEDYYILPNDFVVAQGGGLKKVSWKGYLKKPLGISGVIENTKVESFNRGKMATTYDVGDLFRVTEWTSSISENAKFVQVDGEKFSEALYLSGKSFINDQLNYLYEQYK